MSRKLIVHEQAEDLGSLILGLNEDADRKRFNEMLPILEAHDVIVERYDTIHNPDIVKTKTNLPLFYLDGAMVLSNRYPQIEDVTNWFDIDSQAFALVTRTGILHEANTTRIGACCGVGEDVYLDPNEDEL